MKKRLLSIVLILACIATLLPTTSRAAADPNDCCTNSAASDLLVPPVEDSDAQPHDTAEITDDMIRRSLNFYIHMMESDPELFLREENSLLNTNTGGFDLTEEQKQFVRDLTWEVAEGHEPGTDTIEAVYEYLAINLCYHYGYAISNMDVYSVLTEEYCVCIGYAVAFEVMMQLLGYPCITVTTPNHAWNYVHDGEQWIMYDVTWGSNSARQDDVNYKSTSYYFCRGWSIQAINADWSHIICGMPLYIEDGKFQGFPSDSTIKHYTIPEDVYEVTGMSFDLESVTIHEDVISVADLTRASSNLQTIYFAGSEEDWEALKDKSWSEKMQNVTVVCNWQILDKPTITADVNSDGRPVLTWDEVDGAEKYEVYYKSRMDAPYEKLRTVTGTELTHESAKSNTKYYYKVRAVAENGRSDFGNPRSVTSLQFPNVPTLSVSNNTETGKIVLTWDAPDGADKYEIYRATSENGTYKKIWTGSTNTFTDPDTQLGKTYYYKVRAVYGDEKSAFCEIRSATYRYGTPALTVSNDPSTGKIVLSWNKVDNASKYEIRYSTKENGTYEKLWTGSDSEWIHDSAENGVTYYYKIRALGSVSAATGAYSDIVSGSYAPVAPTLTISNDPDTGKIVLSWTEVPGAEKYEVFYATSKNGTYRRLPSTTKTTLTDTSVAPGRTYYYKVRAMIGATAGEFSAVKYRTCDYARPTLTASTNTSTGKITLSWNEVSSATKYEVWCSTEKSGTYEKLWTGSKTGFTHSDAKSGVTYYYKVRALGSVSAATSAYSKVVSCSCKNTLTAPTLSISNKASTGKIVLSWSKVSGAEKYEVYRATSKNGTYKRLSTTTKTTLTNTSTTPGKTYYYKVRAVAGDTVGAFSKIKSRTCDYAAPTLTISNSSSSGKSILSWDAVDGASKYEIWYATGKSGTYKKLYTTGDTKYTHSAATLGKTYYYKVRAIGSVSAATGAYSDVMSATRILSRPVISLTLSSKGTPIITWDCVSGATDYEVWYATGKNGTYKKLWSGSKTKYTHSGAADGKTYYYKVRAICSTDSQITSKYSTVKSITAK